MSAESRRVEREERVVAMDSRGAKVQIGLRPVQRCKSGDDEKG
jgi:hypothetical protein